MTEAERLEADAERYRWLRDNPTHESTPYFDDGKWLVPYLVSGAGGSGGGVGVKTFDTLDSAIDEAIAHAALLPDNAELKGGGT